VTGQHNFDVPAFHALFRSLPGIDFYIQDLENLVADTEGVFDQYAAFVFYNFHRTTPQGRMKAMLERLGESQQGIVVMHHALLAFPDWPLWSQIVGIEDRSFEYYHGETVDIEVTDADHPISQGLASWRMNDETYLMDDTTEGSRVLLTTDHPKSMRTIAWTRQLKNARVFCLESGHGHETYVDPNYRTVLSRGILWAAGHM
jgi:type 1 glutamine amidotransferase